jgi:hypothetical protein
MCFVLNLNVFNYLFGTKSFSTKYEIIDERIIDNEVANPFKILSAYLITAAIVKPPTAF